jgi:type III secretion protein L
MVGMYRLKELDIRIPARGHVIKAATTGLVAEASGILADAEERGAGIIAAAEARYEEERARGYRDGLDRAAAEAVGRLLDEQATLERSLAGLEAELAAVVVACVGRLIGTAADGDLARAYIVNALRRMRRQKRVRLTLSTAQYRGFRDRIDAITAEFPEIELIDVSENPALEDTRFVMESEIGRIEGSVERSLGQIEDQLLAALRNVAPASGRSAAPEPLRRVEEPA